jgi:hypothetical protein
MAVTENTFTGNGSTTTYAFTFQYLKTTDIKASIGGVATTAFTLPTATTLQFNTAPANSSSIRIYRDTDTDSPAATFYAGSAIKSQDLNDNFLQNLYTTQESKNKTDTSWQTGDETIISTETWASNNTRVATTGAIDARVDAKILTATTEMAVSKLADGAARQVLQTAANGSDVEWTSNVDIPGTLDVTGATTFDGSVTATTFTGNLTGNVTGNTSGSSGSCTGNSVTATEATNVTVSANNSSNETVYPIFVDGATGTQGAESDTGLTYNPSTGVLTSTSFTGNVTGNVTGNTSGSSGSCTGTAATASALTAAATVTNSEQASHSVDDATYFTTSASDARYFNVSSGDTIKDGDTFPDNDTTIATTAAINDRIIDLVDDVGGFVPIANETSFPNANPDVNNGTGTLVSIKALASNLTSNGSGVATIANGTVGNSTVTITGLANSTTYASTFGMIVETTSTLNTYTFHRQVPKATEVTTVAGAVTNINNVGGSISNVNTVAGNLTNINTVGGISANVTTVAGVAANVTTVATNISSVNNFADLYQIASSAPSTDGGSNSLAAGDLYFNTSSNELQVYTGSAWQGGVTATGNLVAKTGDTLTGNLVLDNAKEIRLSETDANGSHYLGFKAPDSVTANVTLALPDGAGSNGQYLKTNGSDTLSWGTISSTPEGTAILSTGESGGTKFLREDGDGSCSWQNVNLSAYAPLAGATFTGAISGPSAIFTDDGASQVVQIKQDDGAVFALRISNDTYSTDVNTGLKTYLQDDGDVVILNRGNSEYTNTYIAQHNGTTSRTLFAGTGAGAAYLYYQNASKLSTTSAGISISGSVTDDKGNVRSIPQNTQGSTYTLVASDAGKHIFASGTVTIPNSVFSAGDAVTIVNNTSSNLTITKTITTMYNAADGTSANRTLATRGMATILFTSGTVAYISGAGLS